MEEITFTLTGEFIELYKLLKVTGLCDSGGEAKHAVAESQVIVDGQIEPRKACKIHQGQSVEFAGKIIRIA